MAVIVYKKWHALWLRWRKIFLESLANSRWQRESVHQCAKIVWYLLFATMRCPCSATCKKNWWAPKPREKASVTVGSSTWMRASVGLTHWVPFSFGIHSHPIIILNKTKRSSSFPCIKALWISTCTCFCFPMRGKDIDTIIIINDFLTTLCIIPLSHVALRGNERNWYYSPSSWTLVIQFKAIPECRIYLLSLSHSLKWMWKSSFHFVKNPFHGPNTAATKHLKSIIYD